MSSKLTRCACAGVSRRMFLSDLGMGFTGLALASLLHQDGVARAGNTEGLWLPPDGQPHFPPKARSVIWLMMRGGVSHLESFDRKPDLDKHRGKTIGQSAFPGILQSPHLKNVREQVLNNIIDKQKAVLYPTQIGFRPAGQLGLEISDWWPHLRAQADNLAFVRSMWTTDNNHGAQLQLLTGRHLLDGCFPTIGAWIHYGLGALSEDLPQFVVMGSPLESQCSEGLDADYLGPEHAGVMLNVDPKEPLPYAHPELAMSPGQQALEARLLGKLNQLTALEYPSDDKLRARIKSYELAFRMQSAVPEVLRFEEENEETRRLYGLDRDVTRPFGQQLLAARRLVERGVRFIQICHGGGAAGAWDAHAKLQENHSSLCAQVDLPTAGLLQDLRQRGLLDETVVVWTTEFGRTPCAQGSDGRDHHNYGFTIWMAGAGLKRGIVHGATDELGFHAVEHRHYVTDIHATLFHLLGLNPRRLEVPGRKRLEIDYGEVIQEILA